MALGISAGDIATLVSVGRRIGNWLTSSSGDIEMLQLLGEDSSSILKRRGIMDDLAFNKRWSKQIRLLANGTPIKLAEEEMKKRSMDPDDILPVSLRPCGSWIPS